MVWFPMGLHYASWISTCSGLEDEKIYTDALSWLTGSSESIKIEKSTSYSGGVIHLINATLNNKNQATKSISRLGKDVLLTLLSEIESRVDDDNCLHLRLDLLSLLSGEIKLATPKQKSTVKGRLKLEVYPGNTAFEVAESIISKAIEDATIRGN